MLLPGTGWDVIGEDAAAGGAAGAGDCVGCASAAAGNANSAMIAAEAKWLDRIVFIESFLGLTLSAIWKGVGGARAGRLAPVGKPLSSRSKRAWRCVVIGRRRPIIDRRRRWSVIPARGDRGTDAQADDSAYDRRDGGVATTTMMIVIPATMPVLGMRGGGYPHARDEHRRGQETYA